MRDRFFWGPRRVDQYCCHGEADLLLRCFYFAAFHAVLEMRSNNATGEKKNQSAKTFGLLPGAMMLCTLEKSSSPYPLHPVVLREDESVVKKTGQLCPFLSPGLLNESWNWFLSRWHLHQGEQPATLRRVSPPEDQGKTLYWMQVNSVLSCCLGKQPPQTSCLSEALTSSPLIALTGSGRLFISPFSQNHLCDWFEGDWSLAVWSIQLTVVKMDAERIWRLCVCVWVTYSNKLWKWHPNVRG